MSVETGDFVGDFLRGQQDCKQGKPHQAGHSEAYDRGYTAEYELEQINDNRTER